MWWNKWRNSNVGLVTRLFHAVDNDPRHGGDESWAKLEAKYGPWPPGPVQLTGGGGMHHLVLPTAGLVSGSNVLGAEYPGIDLRADKGLIVAAPSLHLSGRPYAWDVDHHPLDVPLPPMPQWFLELLILARPTGPRTGPSAPWGDFIAAPCPEGQRNNSLARLTGYLLAHSHKAEEARELARLWNLVRCTPQPLEDAELNRTVDSMIARHRRNGGEN